VTTGSLLISPRKQRIGIGFHFIARFDALFSFLDDRRNLAQAGYARHVDKIEGSKRIVGHGQRDRGVGDRVREDI
jgi:hypothetical protein